MKTISSTAQGAAVDYKKGSYLEYKPSRKTWFPRVHVSASRSDKSTVLRAEIKINKTVYIIWAAVVVLLLMILLLTKPAGIAAPAAIVLPYIIWIVIAAVSVALPVSIFRKDASSAVESLKKNLTAYYKQSENEERKEQDTHFVQGTQQAD